MEKTCIKRTCNRVKSSEYSNGTKGKINNRTCTRTTWKWEIYLHEIMSLTQTWSRSGLSRPVRLVQQILPTELTLSISAMSNITNWEQSFLTTAYNKCKNIPFITTHTRLTAIFSGLFGWARKVKPIWILLKRDSEWHQLGHMQVCTSLLTDNHASTPPLSFLHAGCPSYCPASRHWRQRHL